MAINHHPHSAFLRPLVTLLLLLCIAVEANAYTYTYYIINKKGWTGLWFKETTQTAGNAPSLPDWMRSPLVEKYYYYDDTRVKHTLYKDDPDGRPNTECYYHNGSKVVTDDTILPGKYEYLDKTNELTALPANDANIFVFYDVKSSTMIGNTYIDLSGQLYYNIQDYDNWYIYANELWKDSWGQYQVCSNSLDDLHTWHHRDTKLANTGSQKDNQSYGDLQYDAAYAKSIQPNFSFMLWRFVPVDDNIDPYNFYIKNKMYDEQNNFENTRVLSEENHDYYNSWSESKQTESNQRKAYMYEPTANTSNNYYIKTFALIGNTENVHLVSNSIYLYKTTQTYPSIRNLGYRSFQIKDRHKEGISIINGNLSNDVNEQIMNPKWSIKLTQDRPTTFNMVDLNGRIVLKWQKKISDDSDISVPSSLQSPLAKDFKFYKKTAFTIQGDKFTLTMPSEVVNTVSDISYGDEVFVTYTYNEDQTILDITGNTVTSIKCDDKYLYVEDNGDPTIKAAADQTKSNYRWILDNASVNGVVDPYNILVSNMTNTTTFMSGSTANESLALSNSNTNNRFALLKDSNGNLSFVVSGVSIDTYFDYEHLYVTLYEDGTMTLKQQGYDEATTENQHLTFTPQTTSKVTYHVMNLSGSEAISYSADIVEGDNTINMPSILKSSLAENYTFYSDKACTNEITSLTTGMNDIYVKYTSKQDLILDLSGNTSYSFKLGGQEDPQMWTLTAQTVDGYYDPYNVSIKDSNGNTLMNAPFCILSGIYSESFILMKAKNGDAGTNQYLALGAEGQMEWKEIGDTKISDNNIQAIFGKNITYHFKKLNGEGFRDITLMSNVAMNTTNVIPSEIMTSLAKDYHYYSDSGLTQEITDATNLPSDIYVTYSFNESLTTIDLSGYKDFLAANTYGQFLYYNGTTLTFLNTDNSTGEILWNINGKDGGSLIDPYAVSVINASVNNTFLSVDDNGTMICDNSGTPKTYMITTTADGKLKFVDMSPLLSSFTLSLTEVTHSTYDYTFYIINKKGWTGLWYNLKGQSSDGKIELPNFMRSQLVSTYHYYSTEQVKHTDDYDKGRPLYKCKYGNGSTSGNNISTNNTLAGLYERGTEELTSWPRKNADIFVFYDVKPDEERIIDGVHIDLNGKSYYNIQDRFGSYVFMDKRYVKNSKSEDSQIFSYEYENLQKYLGVTSKTDAQMMWSFYSANEDPYDVQIKNKMISQTYPVFVVVESDKYNNAACPDCWPTSLGGDGDTHSDWSKGKKVYVLTPEMTESEYGSNFRINSFAFLQGTSADTIKLAGSIVGKVTTGKLQSFRYFGLRGYPNVMTRNGMTNVYYGLMRGESDTDVNKYLNNDLYRVQLTEYSDILTYHVINLSGKEATSISEYYSAGNPCELSGMVRSPFATNYKYYLPKDINKAEDGTITINEGATPLNAIPAGTKDIYVTYEYDTASSYNIMGRKGTILYNISAKGNYLTRDGTNLTVATASSKNKNSLWVIECNMVNGMPDPYDAHIYSWSNYEKYLGGETTLSLTDKAGSTSFILGSGTSSSLFTLAKAQAVVEVNGVQKMTYLGCNGSSFVFSEQTAISKEIQTTFTPQDLGYTYHIINLSGEKSLYKAADDLEGVHIPYELSSPAVDNDSYKYYTSSSFTIGSDGLYTLKEDAQPIEPNSPLPYDDYNIYVTYTYTYNAETSYYDLTGGTEYSIIMGDGSYASVMFNDTDGSTVWAPVPDERGYIKPNNDDNNYYSIYDTRALWNFSGNDPYMVEVNNAGRSIYTKLASSTNWWEARLFEKSTTGKRSTHFAVLNMKDGDMRMVGMPFSLKNDVGPNKSTNWTSLNANDNNQISFSKSADGIQNTRTKIVKRPQIIYTYILTRKTDGKVVSLQKEAYVGAEVDIPFELKRHFCTYKFYTDEGMQNEATTYTEDNMTIYVDYTVKDGIFMADGETYISNPEKTFFIDNGSDLNPTYNTLSQHIASYEGREIFSDKKVNNNFEKIIIKGLENQNNRFRKSSPDYLLWYFRGDPYDCQVYNKMAAEEPLVPIHRKQALNIKRYRRDVQLSNSMMESINQEKKDGEDDFHWEMVDSRRGMAEDGMCFALRFKETVGEVAQPETGDAVPERELGKYYFLTPANAIYDPDNNGTRRLNYADGENFDKVMMEGGKIYTFDKNNTNWSALTLRRQAKVSATVYNATNLASSVTKNEVSEYYAVDEKFDALPDNLRRKYCSYTLIDPDDMSELPGSTLYTLTKPKYGPNGKIQTHYIYARYRVNDVNPFTSATETDGQKVLEDANTKWFNFIIDGQNVYFNRNYVGKDDDVKDNDHRISRTKIDLKKDAEGNYIIPKDALHKGLHWALVGDPYKFYVVGHRHRTATYDETGYKMTAGEVGYLGIGSQNEICMSADREYFTFMLDATNTNNFFMSVSAPRLTEQSGNGNRNVAQGSYWEGNWRYGFSVFSGDNYSIGKAVGLIRVKAEADADKEAAQAAVFGQAVGNDVFDCILNVYNGENKVVASSGWTELLRSDAVDANSLPLDIQRYGCTYKCWGDATMTKKQVARYDEKMRRGDRWDYDGSGNPDEEVYVLDDGCFIYTNYSYNSAHYSSENNYHWVNCRFNWTDVTSRTSVWTINKHVKYLKTDSHGQEAEWYGDSWKNDFDKSQDVTEDKVRYLKGLTAPDNEPASPYVIDNKVFGDVDEGQRADEDKKDAILWALVGDPYEFQIKSYLYRNNPFENYYLKVMDSDKTGTANYLKTAKQDAVDYDINNRPAGQPLESTLTPAQKQGFTFTYKVDADGTPYLALKNESATALSRRDPNDILIGAVKSYVTFDYAVTNVEWFDNESAIVGETTYTRGSEYDITTGTDVYKEGEQYVQSQLPFQEIKDSEFKSVQEKRYVYTLKPLADTYIYPVGKMSTDENKLETGGAKNFYVEPMTVTAKQVVFRLKYFRSKTETGYPQTSAFATLNLPTEYFNENKPYPVTLRPEITGGDYLANDYVVENYGVGTSLLLPWSYRRQYCKYFYRLVDVLETTDDVNYTSIKERADIQPYIGKYYDILDENLANYKLIFDVYYQTTEDYVSSTSADDAFWYNLTTSSVTTQEIEPVNFSYLNNMHKGERKNHYTDDWLWAMEGDPYGMKLHNRYAQAWDEVLTIPTIPVAVNVTNQIDPETGESIITGNYSVIIQDPSSRGSYSTVNNITPSTSTGENNKTVYHNSHFFEMMQGNYSTAFLLHPIYAEIQSVYPAYFLSMFLFNAGNWPVQLNEMLDREAKRNAAANWTLQPLAAEQLLPYYDRAGYVGALTPDKATEDEVKTLFGKLKDGSATYADLKQAQKIVHNKANLVPLKKGYYRIKAMSDEALTAYEADKTQYSGTRYASAFLTKSELSEDGKSSALPLNFWATLADNQGDLNYSDLPADQLNQSFNRELLAAEYDPSSIFYFVPTLAEGETVSDQTKWTVSSQGININNIPYIDDIGGTLFTMRSGTDMKTGYLNCSPDTKRFALNTGTNNELHEKYDIQDTKWLLQPVGDQGYAMPLKFETLDGGDGYKYCSAYLSHDIQLSDNAEAWVADGEPYENGERKRWEVLCKKIGEDASFVPALTPVIIRCRSDEDLYATIPTDAPTPTSYTPSVTSPLYGSLFAREVNDETLATESEKNAVNTGNEVYVFGKANGTAYFYLNGNANPHNANAFDTKYLYHNKAFLIETPAINASPLRVCVPVFSNMSSGIGNIYADDDKDKGPIYDLQGRKVKKTKRGVYIQDKKKFVVVGSYAK